MNFKKSPPPADPPEPNLSGGPGDKLLKRSEAARMLGVSVSTLRRREGELIRPVVDANGIHRFAESELKAVMVTVRHRQAISSMGPSAGDVAADVFTLLDDGHHPAEIVKQLRLPPDVVVALHDQWARMHEAFVVNKEDADEIARHARARRAKSAAEAVAQISSRVATLLRLGGSPQCRFCRDNSSCVCEPCVLQWRGPLATHSVKLERRTDDDGIELRRVVAEVCLAETLDDGSGVVADLRSDWYRKDRGPTSPIAPFVEALETELVDPTKCAVGQSE